MDISSIIQSAVQYFDPKSQYAKNGQQWQAFDYFVLANADMEQYHALGSHPGQLDFLINSTKFENVLHAGNGFGKTDIIARKHIVKHLLHFFDFLGARKKPYRTLNIAITNDQAEIVQDRIISILNNCPLRFLIKSVVKHPRPEIRLINGSVIEFRTTKRKAEAVEGHEYGYISADEIALEQHLEFIREKVLIPRLRSYADSQMDWFATPKGLNAYYRICRLIAQQGGYVRAGSSYENPHINHQVLQYMSQNWSREKVLQIVYGQFIYNPNFMFSSRVARLFDSSLEFEEVIPGSHYIESWDLARGRKGATADKTVGYRLRRTSSGQYVVANRWAFQLPWTEKERSNLMLLHDEQHPSSIEGEIRRAQRESNADVYIDSTGVGDTLWAIVMDIARAVDFRGHKDKILDHAQAVIDAGMVQSPYIAPLVEAMTVYERDDKGIDTDDLMALCIGLYQIPLVSVARGTVDG